MNFGLFPDIYVGHKRHSGRLNLTGNARSALLAERVPRGWAQGSEPKHYKRTPLEVGF